MIIRRITISSWRSLERFERELEPGLNLLKGPNEAGKSSIIEAVGWGLYRDIVDAGQIKNDITPIIPAGDRKARPQVELLLEFPDCTATISKTLAEESAQRECVLVVRRPGAPDESFDQGQAQAELKKLIANDGAANAGNNGIALERDILLSAQGQSTAMMGNQLSNAARAAAASIAIGQDGGLALTPRLEKIRGALEKQKKKELFEKLTANAVDGARKSTQAASLRDKLAELRETHAKYCAVEAQIASLRALIDTLKTDLAQTRQTAQQAQSEMDVVRSRHTAQLKADSEVADLRRAHDEAMNKRDEWQRRLSEITRWKSEAARADQELQNTQARLHTAQTAVTESETRQQTARDARAQYEEQLQATSREVEMWSAAYDVFVAHRERKRAAHRLEQLQDAQSKLEAAQAQLAALGKAPIQAQLSLWQRQYSELESARRQNAHSLRLALRLQRALSVQWQTDGGEARSGEAAADTEFVIEGAQTISVVVPGIGCIDVAGEGRETRKLQSELDAKTRTLENQLKPFGLTWRDLPDAFNELETRCIAHAAATQELQSAQTRSQSVLDAGDSPAETRTAAADWEAHWKSAREKFKQTGRALPEGCNEISALRERDRWIETDRAQRKLFDEAQKTYQGALAALSSAKSGQGQLHAKMTALEDLSKSAVRELALLQGDKTETDQTRAQVLDELNTRLYESKIARDAAIAAREKLGEAVSDETLAHARHEAELQGEALHRLQTELAERRMELRGHCEQDPQTELEKLDYEIESREVELARHESRLRGIALLDAALEAQRHRLGRELGTPLNTFLSPWLSALRGKETHLEFDENGGRIVGIRTDNSGSTHILPFDSHSGGMQEQTALVLRLILARLAARQLPSGKLPLLLDDPLTQTDTTRREGLWRVLREAGENLQLLFVTCHQAQLPGGQAHHIVVGEWNEAASEPAMKKNKPKRTHKSKPAAQQQVQAENQAEEVPTLGLW